MRMPCAESPSTAGKYWPLPDTGGGTGLSRPIKIIGRPVQDLSHRIDPMPDYIGLSFTDSRSGRSRSCQTTKSQLAKESS